ncbi:MAG TPA: hypothetical protein PK976_03610, partial [Bacteroidales bacterium]|nr:hypothetical protein [Bacteroidales bacterium]
YSFSFGCSIHTLNYNIALYPLHNFHFLHQPPKCPATRNIFRLFSLTTISHSPCTKHRVPLSIPRLVENRK